MSDERIDVEVHYKMLKDLAMIYNPIIGKKYKDLTNDQKRILYAVELWKDGMDIDQVMENMVFLAKGKAGLPDEYIDKQLRYTFAFLDGSQVPNISEPREVA
jgi:hypothetical protein